MRLAQFALLLSLLACSPAVEPRCQGTVQYCTAQPSITTSRVAGHSDSDSDSDSDSVHVCVCVPRTPAPVVVPRVPVPPVGFFLSFFCFDCWFDCSLSVRRRARHGELVEHKPQFSLFLPLFCLPPLQAAAAFAAHRVRQSDLTAHPRDASQPSPLILFLFFLSSWPFCHDDQLFIFASVRRSWLSFTPFQFNHTLSSRIATPSGYTTLLFYRIHFVRTSSSPDIISILLNTLHPATISPLPLDFICSATRI